ncbi:hypothetical protein KIF24_27860 [Micromonospora sp. Llam7]|nr:hypothetical protein [Micromonospora tarapacensis]
MPLAKSSAERMRSPGDFRQGAPSEALAARADGRSSQPDGRTSRGDGRTSRGDGRPGLVDPARRSRLWLRCARLDRRDGRGHDGEGGQISTEGADRSADRDPDLFTVGDDQHLCARRGLPAAGCGALLAPGGGECRLRAASRQAALVLTASTALRPASRSISSAGRPAASSAVNDPRS